MENNWKQIGSPVADLMAQVEARMKANEALEASAVLIETARQTGNASLRRLAAQQIANFEREAVRQQLAE